MPSTRSLAVVLLASVSVSAAACGGDSSPADADAGAHDAAAGPDAPPVHPVTLSVVTHHNGPTRDGHYIAPALTRAAVASLHADPAFHATIHGPTYAHPLFYDAGAGGKDLVVVATEQNDVYALDAKTGAEVWHVNLGAPAPLSALPCGNIDPLGVTGTPYLDEQGKLLYLDAMLLVAGAPRHHIFALSLVDGSAKPGWPAGGIDVNTAAHSGSFSFDSSTQNQRGAVLVHQGTLYVPYGGHFGDCGTYRGWLVGVPVADPTNVKAWATRAEGAGSWAPGGVASDGTSLFLSTGNGFGASTWSDQEAIVRLAPGPVFSAAAADYWAPANWKELDDGDVDLGGSGPVLVDVPGATPSALAVALGKDGNAYLIDRAQMGGVSTPLAKRQASEGAIITAAAAYPTAQGANVVFHGFGLGCPSGQSGDLTALRITATSPPKLEVAWCAAEDGGGSPIATSVDGHGDSIVWTVGAEESGELRAFDGDTGQVIFHSANLGEVNRFVSPIVGKGRVYIAGKSAVFAFVP
jgi:outer membrane protein assembly factor BamB